MNEKRGITNRRFGVVAAGFGVAMVTFGVAAYSATPLSYMALIGMSVVSLAFAAFMVLSMVSRPGRWTDNGVATKPR